MGLLSHPGHRLRRGIRRHGLLGALRLSVRLCSVTVPCNTYYYMRNLPFRVMERRFDHKHGVDTDHIFHLDQMNVIGNAEFSHRYQATRAGALCPMMRHLPLTYENFIFVDLGSGMGRALLMASDYPFKKIIGVEFSPELHHTAQQNIRNYKSDVQSCWNIESVCMDALEYQWPLENIVLYMYNPFRRPIMDQVLERLRLSLIASSRDIWIIYNHPSCDLAEFTAYLEMTYAGEQSGERFMIYHRTTDEKSSTSYD